MREGEPTKFCTRCGPGHSDEECPKREGESESVETGEKFDPEPQPIEWEELIDFLKVWRRINGLTSADQKRESFNINWWLRNLRKSMEGQLDYHPYFFAIKKGGQMIGTGALEVSTDETGVKFGHLSQLTVAPEERGKEYDGEKLHQKLTRVRMEKARAEGCVYVDTSVFSRNPEVIKALATKLRDGYRITRFNDYGEGEKKYEVGSYTLTKRIDGSAESELTGEKQQLRVSDLKGIDDILQSGWVGVDIQDDLITLQKLKEST